MSQEVRWNTRYREAGDDYLLNLYTREILLDAFADWEIEELVDYEDDIAEGLGHKGRSALIGLVARKPYSPPAA